MCAEVSDVTLAQKEIYQYKFMSLISKHIAFYSSDNGLKLSQI